jgi:hypothetical protein
MATWILVLAVGTIALAACDGGGRTAASPPRSPSPSTGVPASPGSRFTPPPCQFPSKIAFPEWIPSDLPLPKGTYATQVLPSTQGYNRGLFVVPVDLRELTRFVLAEWPAQGWVLGRGDSEIGEVDDQFTRPPSVGAFRARAQFCDPGYVLMLLIYIPDRSKVTTLPIFPSASGSPSPLASASP